MKRTQRKYSDLHCHILPGIDDGAQNWDQSLAMAREASDAGTARLFATSHQRPDFFNNTVGEIRRLTEELSQKLDHEGIGLTVYCGAEIHISPDLPKKFSDKELMTLGTSDFILLEFPFNFLPSYALEITHELMLKGAGIILAHPERNSVIRRDISICEDLVKKGIYLQVNTGSITGSYGSHIAAFARKLIKRDLVHFIGSDAHHPGTLGRGPDMSIAIEEICRLSPRKERFVDYIEDNVDRLLSKTLPLV